MLPRCRRELVTVELFDDRSHTFDTTHLLLGRDVLPVQEEAHEIRRGDRFDLSTQPIDRVTVDAREEPPIAPFERASGRVRAFSAVVGLHVRSRRIHVRWREITAQYSAFR